MDPTEAFKVLRPACINVAKFSNEESVAHLRTVLLKLYEQEKKDYPNEWLSFINDLQQYLAFPLLLILQKDTKRSQSFDEEISSLLLFILQNSCCNDFSYFKKVFFQLITLVTSQECSQKVSTSCSEECKISTLEALSALYKSCSESILVETLKSDFRAQLGHAIFLCLRMAENETNRKLRISAFECLLSIGLFDNWEDLTNDTIFTVSRVFAYFLPGIIIATVKIANASDIQGHKITVMSLKCFNHFIKAVLQDSSLGKDIPLLGVSKVKQDLQSQLLLEKISKNCRISESKKSEPEDEKTTDPRILNITVDIKWVEDTSNKIYLLTNTICKLMTHSHWAVRLALNEWARTVFIHCPRSLNLCVMSALEVVVVLSSDECEEVCVAAQETLVQGKYILEQDNMEHLWDVVEEHIFQLSTKLTYTVKLQEDKETLAVLKQLSGCVQLLGREKMSSLISGSTLITTMIRSLLILFTYCTDDHNILAETTFFEDDLTLIEGNVNLGESFKYMLPGSGVYEEGKKICEIIGNVDQQEEVVLTCINTLQSQTQLKQLFLILSFIISSTQRENDEAVKYILEFVESFKIMEMQTSLIKLPLNDKNTPKSIDNFSVENCKHNILTIKNALQLFGHCAQSIGNHFDTYLSKVLWMTMEKAGDPNILIASSATKSIRMMSTAMGFNQVQDFIKGKVSQFWYYLSLRLNRLDLYPSSPLMLKFILSCGISEEIQDFINELIEEILIALDKHHESSSISILNVLLVYVNSFSKCMPQISPIQSRSQKSDNQSLSNYLIEINSKYLKTQEIFNENSDDDNIVDEMDIPQTQEEMDCDTNDEEVKEKIPQHIQLIKNIFEKCSFLLYTNDKDIILVIYSIIIKGAPILSSYENEALPAFHKLWKPLCQNVKKKDYILMMKSFETAATLVKFSGDFLMKRFTDDFLLISTNFLINQNIYSLERAQISGYNTYPDFKAQLRLLKILPDIVPQLNLSVINTTLVFEAVVPYINPEQPKELCESAIKAVDSMSKIYPSHAWLCLSSKQKTFQLNHSSNLFKSIKLGSSISDSKRSELWKDIFDKL